MLLKRRSHIERLARALNQKTGARSSVVSWGTMLQAGMSRDLVPMRWIFSIDPILPDAL
jgi:hypothetical protein